MNTLTDLIRTAVTTLILTTGLATTAEARSFAYVPNNDTHDLSVVDTASNEEVDRVAVPGGARGAVVSASGSVVYVTHQAGDGVSVIDAFTNQIATTIPIGPFPFGFPEAAVLAPGLGRLYFSTEIDRLGVIDTSTNTLDGAIVLSASTTAYRGLAISPDESRLYATARFVGEVKVVDTATETVVATIASAGDGGIAIERDGSTAYAVHAAGSAVNLIDLATNTVTSSIALGSCGPTELSFDSDDSTLYVACISANTVKVIDVGTATVTDTIALGPGTSPIGLDLTADDAFLYVALNGADSLAVIDTSSNTVVDTVTVGNEPIARGSRFVGPEFECGNATVEPGEGCDDGDTDDGDECTNACLEPHDSVVLPVKPLTVKLSEGTAMVVKSLKVQVRNADASGESHSIALATDTGCPGVETVGEADFDKRAAGSQSEITLAGGESAKGSIPITIRGSDFTTFNSETPTRCTITLSVDAGASTVDPIPSNNTFEVELNVLDGNDAEQSALHETAIDSLKPIKVKVSEGSADEASKTKLVVRNGDFIPTADAGADHVIVVDHDDGSCPAGLLGDADMDSRTDGAQAEIGVAGGDAAKGSIPLTIRGIDFVSTALSPARCSATVTATGPSGDTDATNNSAHLTIDVYDGND